MRVIVIMESSDSRIGFSSSRVAAVCEDWIAAEQEKKRLSDIFPNSKYSLIERTLTKRNNP